MKDDIQKEINWLLREKYNGKRTLAAEKDILRLKNGEHIDYVIGWVNFLGCKIDLSKHPLIPRPETEYWAEQAINEIQGIASRTIKFSSRFTLKGSDASQKISSFSRQLKVLDIFAGSGCIGISILKSIPNIHVDFAEKDESLLEQITINANLNEISNKRYRVVQSDIFSHIQETYNYIFANPPYVAEERKDGVQKSVLEQEPYQAVFGGKDGLYYIREFFTNVKDHLVPGGIVYIEFDSQQKEEIKNLAQKAGATEIDIHKDQFANWRYARLVF